MNDKDETIKQLQDALFAAAMDITSLEQQLDAERSRGNACREVQTDDQGIRDVIDVLERRERATRSRGFWVIGRIRELKTELEELRRDIHRKERT